MSPLFTKSLFFFLFHANIVFIFLFAFCSESKELIVGEDKGWAPLINQHDIYNQWASTHRFLVNDTLRFEYNKDSVMAVTEDEYSNCHSLHPSFFANDGDTVFTLDRPGLFYFISGVAGHCQLGLKMAVKVLEPPPSPPLGLTVDHSSAAGSSEFILVIVFSIAFSLLFRL